MKEIAGFVKQREERDMRDAKESRDRIALALRVGKTVSYSEQGC